MRVAKLDDRNKKLQHFRPKTHWFEWQTREINRVPLCSWDSAYVRWLLDSFVIQSSGGGARQTLDPRTQTETNRRLSLCESKLQLCRKCRNAAYVFVMYVSLDHPACARLRCKLGGPDVEQWWRTTAASPRFSTLVFYRATVYATARCPSVCPSVRHKPVL